MTYYQMGGDQAAMSMATNYGALSLYLNFINLFQSLLMPCSPEAAAGKAFFCAIASHLSAGLE